MEVNRQLFGYKLAKRYLISLYYMLALLKPCWEFVLSVFLWSAQKLLNAMPYIETLNIFECTGCVVKPFSIILWWWGSRSVHVQTGYLHFKRLRSWHKLLWAQAETDHVQIFPERFGQLVSTMNKHTTPSWKPTSCFHGTSTTLPLQLWLDTDSHGLTWVLRAPHLTFRKQLPNV